MSDNITVRGFVATEIRSSTTPGGVATASFRLGATDRCYDRAASAWVDGNTNWFTVQGYRQLAGNLGCSVKKGQRVIVVGRLKMRSWEKDGRVYHDVEIDAESVGHDLMWGSANFTRSAGAGRQADAGTRAPEASDPEASDPGDGAGNRDGGMPADGGDGDGGEAAGGGHGGDERHAIVVNDETGEEEEVDQETGELKGAA
jgi:single-strand DNA-binding protein